MNDIRRKLLGALAACTSAALCDARAQGAAMPLGSLAARKQAVPLEYFGLHIHEPKTPWPDYRFGRLRLWDTRTSWFHLQPERNRWDFARLDGFVQQAEQRGVGVVLPLGLTPAWAAARPTERSPYNVPGAASEPADIADWKAYVQTVARRYKGRIHHYEIWNEVNAGAGFFTGTAESMFELQRTAFEVLKSIDPGITVISPSTEGSTEDKFVWFERYMTLMAGRYADVVAYHFYIPRKPPEALLPVVQRIQAILARTGNGHLPLWNTESGYRVDWGSAAPLTGTWATWPNLPPALAAAWLVRAYLLGWLAGLESYFWYGYDTNVMGMVPASREASVVSDALGLAIRRMTGRVFDGLALDDGAAIVRARYGTDECWWVWSTDDAVRTWKLPPRQRVTLASNLVGRLLPLKDGRVEIGPMPILLAAELQQFGP